MSFPIHPGGFSHPRASKKRGGERRKPLEKQKQMRMKDEVVEESLQVEGGREREPLMDGRLKQTAEGN